MSKPHQCPPHQCPGHEWVPDWPSDRPSCRHCEMDQIEWLESEIARLVATLEDMQP